MKKARFWAIFMTGLLVFSTLTNDYIVANAEDLEGATETVEEEKPQLDADDGYVLSEPEQVDKETEGEESGGSEDGGIISNIIDTFVGGGDEGITGGSEGYDEGYAEGSEGYAEGGEGYVEGGDGFLRGVLAQDHFRRRSADHVEQDERQHQDSEGGRNQL